MEQVVLVDVTGTPIGVEERLTAHREGHLHLAISAFVFDDTGRVLLQRRAPTKELFSGRWANTCCTHPRPGEGVVEAAERRLREELGLEVALTDVGSFTYEANDPDSGLTEHEFDHVLVGVTDQEPTPNPAEVDGLRWVNLDELRVVANEPQYAPWLGPALRELPDLEQD